MTGRGEGSFGVWMKYPYDFMLGMDMTTDESIVCMQI